MKKRLLIMLILSIGIMGMLLTDRSTQGQQNPQQDPFDEPTIVKRGKPTKKKQEYSKHFRNRNARPRNTINEKIKRGITKVTRSRGTRAFAGLNHSASEFFQNLACQSDAIVVGSPKKKTSDITDDDTWVFTEYELLVKDVLKNNQSSPINPGSIIQVARTGGSVKLDNTVFSIENYAFRLFKKNKEYLLFLRYIPETNAYRADVRQGSFVLKGKQFELTEQARFSEEINEKLRYERRFDTINDAVSAGCNSTGRG